MKPIIKKPELLVLKKSVDNQAAQELVTQLDSTSIEQPIVEPESAIVQPLQDLTSLPGEYTPTYASESNYPLVQSVGNSGWQVSEIWRDLRVDGFY